MTGPIDLNVTIVDGGSDVSVVDGDINVLVNDDSSVVVQVATGQTGPQGPAGSGGDLNFTYQQQSAASVWTIAHGLNKFPSVTVVDTAGNETEGAVAYIDINNLTVTFGAAFSGVAYLN